MKAGVPVGPCFVVPHNMAVFMTGGSAGWRCLQATAFPTEGPQAQYRPACVPFPFSLSLTDPGIVKTEASVRTSIREEPPTHPYLNPEGFPA